MTQSFLRIVAEDILRKHGADLSDTVVVFPNKRASLFMNRCLFDIVKRPLFSPRYMTMSELVRSKSPLSVAGELQSVASLYRVYSHVAATGESIDRFFGWGKIMLADFDDIDKRLADPAAVLCNTGDLHSYDNVSYLTEEQRQTLEKFFSEFRDNHESFLRQQFEQLWNNLLEIYTGFNRELKQQNLAYEGALYKDAALRAEELSWHYSRYIFVGFNLLWESEQRLFSALQDKGLARFYWDYDRYYTGENAPEAGRFIKECLKRYPKELDNADNRIYDNFSSGKSIACISAPTEDIQARYAAQWLQENNRTADGETTAIVLADENLLNRIIPCLPLDISGKANITIGLPLAGTPARSLAVNFLRLHIYGFNADEQAFMAKDAMKLLSHPYISLISGEAEALGNELFTNRAFTATPAELCRDEALELLFTPINISKDDANRQLLRRLSGLFSRIGLASGKDGDAGETPSYEEQVMQESVYRMYTILTGLDNIISAQDLSMQPATLLRLVDNITRTTSMPLHGEPASGLQIAGILETRNLDFGHLLVLSCNEGNLPKGFNSPSLLPWSVRKAYNLTVADTQAAVYAYYFYRLLQRCNDVTIVYNSSTDNGRSGQMSRFMLQLMAESDHEKTHITHLALSASQMPFFPQPREIVKNGRIMEIINGIRSLSPSSVNSYMRCPLQFYYDKIAGGIKEPASNDITDVRMFGMLIHSVAEHIYNNIRTPQNVITREAISLLLDEKKHSSILRHVDEAIQRHCFNGRKCHYDGMQLISREVIKRYTVNLLTADRELAPFSIEGLEKKIYGSLSVPAGGNELTIQIGGIIDRLDKITDSSGRQVLRVVDYKTGSKGKELLLKNVDEVFNIKNIKDNHSGYYLQAMLYSMLVRHSDRPFLCEGEEHPPLNAGRLPVVPALLFIQKKDSIKDPVLKFGDPKAPQPISDILDYEVPFRENLQGVISQIFDPSVPFRPTEIEKHCEHCAYIKICRRGKTA